MKRETVIRKVLSQLGEAGYFVRLPSPDAKVMYVSMPNASVTVRGVRLALEPNVLEALDNVPFIGQAVKPVPVGAMVAEGSKFEMVSITLPNRE